MADEQIKNEDKLLSALAYPIPFLPLFLIFTEKKNIAFCKYHGWQGLFWQIACILASVALTIIATALSFFNLGCIMGLLSQGMGLAILVISILFAVKVYGGEYLTIPVITDFAKKYIEGQ